MQIAGEQIPKTPAFLQYAFNLFSHNSPMTENGYNEEEMKMVKETRKIWGTQDVDITATCIRVPIMRAHAESINLELEREMSEDEVGSCTSHQSSYTWLNQKVLGPPVLDDRIQLKYCMACCHLQH